MTARATAPGLSVVLVAIESVASVRATLARLRTQTVRDRIELVLVVPDAAVSVQAEGGELEGFAAVRAVPIGRIDDVDRATAAGVMHATAPFVALIEDHALPAPDWAERVMAAHATPADAVGPAIVNANPRRLASWTNYLIAYGEWSEQGVRGRVDAVPGHNASFRTALLQSFGDRLGGMLRRDGGLIPALRERGATFFREPAARVAHVNPSRWSSTARLRFDAGRAWAAARAVRHGWPLSRRLVYALAGPLIPAVRFVREARALRAAGSGAETPLRTAAALVVGLLFDALGQVAGYAAGPGTAPARLATFEMDRLDHIVPDERALLRPAAPRA